MPLRPHPIILMLASAVIAACTTTAGRAPAKTAIGQVQGEGQLSPMQGRAVRVEGVVTADLRDGLGGFFVQDQGDGDPATSDALFVIAAAEAQPAIKVGDRVRIDGTVTELATGVRGGTLTAIEPTQVTMLGRGDVQPTALQQPPRQWEALEGMRLRIDAPLTVSGTGTLARFGELATSFEGRLWQPSEIAVPGSSQMQQALADNARRGLLLDDGSNVRDPGPVHYLRDRPTPRSGSTAVGVEGVLDQRHGGYRLQATAPLQLTYAPRPPAPQVSGSLRVAVFNLENLFNGDGRGGGFPTARGAQTPQQLVRQTQRLVATLDALQPDIAALMELENDGFTPQSSIAQLVDAFNAGSNNDWRYVDAGQGPGADQIRVGLLYRSSRVSPVGAPAVLEGGPFGHRSRVPLAQAFRRGNGEALVVVANHFKSKGCSESAGADADGGDGQGCWNAVRTDSARRLDAWMKTDPTGTGSAGRLPLQMLVGDFNAYAMEDPMRMLRGAGWVDALTAFDGERPYSYVYNGLAGRLDHALLSPALAKKLQGASEWHSNADEPDSAGYADNASGGPWRSSDHDPLLLGLDL